VRHRHRLGGRARRVRIVVVVRGIQNGIHDARDEAIKKVGDTTFMVPTVQPRVAHHRREVINQSLRGRPPRKRDEAMSARLILETADEKG
jgi:hypothetical protein